MNKTTSRASSRADRVTTYARKVAAEKIVAGPLVRLAAARHLDDLAHGHERGLRWDPKKADRVFKFFERVLRLNGGEHEGKPFILQPWQAFIVGCLFGWVLADGSRRFQTAYLEIGKGNGKSPLAAGVGLYGLIADGEARAEIYAAATKKDQAQILFRDAVAMVDLSPALARVISKSGGTPVWNLGHVQSGSWFRPISSDDSQSGPRPHIALVDEVHEHKTSQVLDLLRAGFKGRRQPMLVEITNSGVDRTSICYRHHEYSERVLQGSVKDDAWFAFVCNLDPSDDPLEDESCWLKANPNLGVSVTLKYLHGLVHEARGMPAKASVVRRLNFCEWVDADNPAIDRDAWMACQSAFLYADLAELEPVGALDLSGTRDLTALGLWWPAEEGTPARFAAEFWTPEEGLLERAKRDRVPYDAWARDGFITTTPGRSVNYRWVAIRLGELQQEIGLRRVAFDAYRIKYLERELEQLGIEIELVPHGQGFYKAAESGLWMPHSIEVAERAIIDKTIRIRPNPALTFAAASAVHEEDPKGNRIYTKRRSKGRIDGMVVLAMAAGLADGGLGEGVPDDYVPLVA